MFGDRVLKRIFENRKDEMTGGWIKLHKEDSLNPAVSQM
jgi:hypothetical protein